MSAHLTARVRYIGRSPVLQILLFIAIMFAVVSPAETPASSVPDRPQ